MNRSGGGILAVAILAMMYAGSGRPTASTPQASSTAATSRAARSGASGNQSASRQSTSNPTAVSGDGGGVGLDGYADETKSLLSVIRSATNTNLPDSEHKALDAILATWQGNPSLGVMIALVPDPVKTHMSLLTDRYLDAIEQSMEDSGFYFDRAMLPWDTQNHPESRNFVWRDLASEYTEEQESVPGVLIFRRQQPCEVNSGTVASETSPCKTSPTTISHNVSTLLMLVVGETPTAGVNRKQFASALLIAQRMTQSTPEKPPDTRGKNHNPTPAPSQGHGSARWEDKAASRSSRQVSSLPRPSTPLNIIGPSFTGSLSSLAKELENSGLAFSPITIASGSVGGYGSAQEFNHSIAAYGKATINFVSMSESSQVLEEALLKHACDEWHIWPKGVAILSETETAFGSQVSNADHICPDHAGSDTGPVPLRLTYPRGIYHVRTAYAQQFPDGQGEGENQPQLRNNLRPDLEESRTASDSIPDFSTQTPLSEDAELMGVVDELQKHHIQLVVLSATDPLDALFLVRYLRKNFAYGHLVVIGPDLLLRHEAGDPLMRGVMALSVYELVPNSSEGATALKDHDPDHLVFPDDGSVGVYNASQLMAYCLLYPEDGWCTRRQAPGLTESRSDETAEPYLLPGDISLAGYRPSPLSGAEDANRSAHRPEIHLDALGRGGFWPIATLPSTTSWLPRQASPSTVSCVSVRIESDEHSPRGRIAASWKTVWLVLMGWFVFLILFFWNGSLLSTLEAEVLLAPECTGDCDTGREPLCARVQPRRSGLTRSKVIEIFCFSWGAVLAFMVWPLLRDWSVIRAQRVTAIVFSAVVYVVLGWFAWRNFRAWRYHFAFLLLLLMLGFIPLTQPAIFQYQYLHMGSLLSPLLPVLLISLSFCWWAWCNLSGCVLTDLRRPRLPSEQSLPTMLRAISSEEQQNLDAVMRPGHLDKRIWVPAVVVFGLALVILARQRIHSLQHFSYDFLLIGMLIVSFLLLLESSLRVLAVWSEASQLLRLLENQPFRFAISQVGGFSWTTIWKIGAGSLTAAHSLLAREMEALKFVASMKFVAPTWAVPGAQLEDFYPKNLILKVWEIYGQLLEKRRPRLTGKAAKQWEALAKSSDSDCSLCKTTISSDSKNQAQQPGAQSTEHALLNQFSCLQQRLAEAASRLLSRLFELYGERPEVRCEQGPESLAKLRENPPATEKDAMEYFVSMVYINYIITILLRIRSLALAAVGIFVLDVIALNSYPFEPRAMLRTLLFVTFASLTACFGLVYAKMHRDATLSRITDTKPGELGGDYWTRMLSVTLLPLLSLLATQFPSIGNFLFSWIEPAVKALR